MGTSGGEAEREGDVEERKSRPLFASRPLSQSLSLFSVQDNYQAMQSDSATWSKYKLVHQHNHVIH